MICDDCQKQDMCNLVPEVEDWCGRFCPRSIREGKEIATGPLTPKTAKPKIVPPACGGLITVNEARQHFMPAGNAIADTGNRTQFPTGAVRDIHIGKGRMDLLPWAAIMEISRHCEQGAVKYGERNIDKGIPMHSLIDSAFRHMAKYMEGKKDEKHLTAACWNLLWAVQFEETKPEMQDIPGRLTDG